MHTFRKWPENHSKVGWFAHSLRVRLMRKHIGIDIDALDDKDTQASHYGHVTNVWDPNTEQRPL